MRFLSFSDYLRPYLNHSFQNVRERLGSILINIFEADLQFVDGPEPECPRINNIITEVVQKIQVLQNGSPIGNLLRFLFIIIELTFLLFGISRRFR